MGTIQIKENVIYKCEDVTVEGPTRASYKNVEVQFLGSHIIIFRPILDKYYVYGTDHVVHLSGVSEVKEESR